MPSAAVSAFRPNVARVRDLVGLERALAGSTTPAVDVSDLLRACLVLLVSALDTYVHERVREGMLAIHRTGLGYPPAFETFNVTMSSVRSAIAAASSSAWLEQEIRRQHGLRSFQKSDRIAEAFRLMSATALWDSAAADLGQPAKDLKVRLDLVVDRRNQIAHEADLDPTSGTRWPISPGDVVTAIDLVEQLVECFDRIV